MLRKIFSKLRKRPDTSPKPVADDAPDGTIGPDDPRYDVMMSMMRPGGPSIVIGNLDEETGEWGVTGYDENGEPMAVQSRLQSHPTGYELGAGTLAAIIGISPSTMNGKTP